jgi:hypothetical protein
MISGLCTSGGGFSVLELVEIDSPAIRYPLRVGDRALAPLCGSISGIARAVVDEQPEQRRRGLVCAMPCRRVEALHKQLEPVPRIFGRGLGVL